MPGQRSALQEGTVPPSSKAGFQPFQSSGGRISRAFGWSTCAAITRGKRSCGVGLPAYKGGQSPPRRFAIFLCSKTCRPEVRPTGTHSPPVQAGFQPFQSSAGANLSGFAYSRKRLEHLRCYNPRNMATLQLQAKRHTPPNARPAVTRGKARATRLGCASSSASATP